MNWKKAGDHRFVAKEKSWQLCRVTVEFIVGDTGGPCGEWFDDTDSDDESGNHREILR